MKTGFLLAFMKSGELTVMADPTVPVTELNPMFKKATESAPKDVAKLELWRSDIGLVKRKVFCQLPDKATSPTSEDTAQKTRRKKSDS